MAKFGEGDAPMTRTSTTSKTASQAEATEAVRCPGEFGSDFGVRRLPAPPQDPGYHADDLELTELQDVVSSSLPPGHGLGRAWSGRHWVAGHHSVPRTAVLRRLLPLAAVSPS